MIMLNENNSKNFGYFKVHRAEISTTNNKIFTTMSNSNPNKMDERSKYIYEKLDTAHCSHSEKEFIKQINENFPYQFFVEGDVAGNNKIRETRITKALKNKKTISFERKRLLTINLKILSSRPLSVCKHLLFYANNVKIK